jgi:hypothetical protein
LIVVKRSTFATNAIVQRTTAKKPPYATAGTKTIPVRVIAATAFLAALRGLVMASGSPST